MPERREGKPQPLLPVVSPRTIAEWGPTAEINPRFLTRVASHDERNFSNIVNSLMALDDDPMLYFKGGGIVTYLLLGLEARRQGIALPKLPEDALFHYILQHPLGPVSDAFAEQGILFPSKAELTRQADQLEYTIPTIEKYKKENPLLMRWLKNQGNSIMNKLFIAGKTDNAFLSTGFEPGGLAIYEIFRMQAERDVLRRMTK